MPRTTKHLTAHQFKKGEPTANPLGRGLEKPEIKALRNLSEQEMVEIGSLVVKGSIEQLKKVKDDPKSSVLKCMMAAVAIKTISTGNPQALDILLTRLVGKPKDHVVVTSNNTSTITAAVGVVQLEANVKATMDKLESEC
jgi:hypothetical protein